MRRGVPAFLLLLALPILSAGAPAAPQSTDCATWSECRALVEEAIATGAFQQAHDLAWRAVQLGPKDDADLMFLLARAQSLAGRPHDALVMVRRLAERGIATGSETHPDLVRMRALPGWPDVQALVASASASASADHTAVASPRPGNALAPGSPDGLAVSGKKSEPSVSSSGTAADPASPKTAAVEAGAAQVQPPGRNAVRKLLDAPHALQVAWRIGNNRHQTHAHSAHKRRASGFGHGE